VSNSGVIINRKGGLLLEMIQIFDKHTSPAFDELGRKTVKGVLYGKCKFII